MISQRSGCLTTILTLFFVAAVGIVIVVFAMIGPVEAEPSGACDGEPRNQFGHCS